MARDSGVYPAQPGVQPRGATADTWGQAPTISLRELRIFNPHSLGASGSGPSTSTQTPTWLKALLGSLPRMSFSERQLRATWDAEVRPVSDPESASPATCLVSEPLAPLSAYDLNGF